MVIALPGQASAAEISCIVNSVAVSGSTISGTSGDDTIRCYEGVARGVSIEVGAGNDTIFGEATAAPDALAESPAWATTGPSPATSPPSTAPPAPPSPDPATHTPGGGADHGLT